MIFKDQTELNQLLYQLHHLYSTSGTYGIYDLVYDKLVEDGHSIKFDKETKDHIWNAARKRFNKDEKRTIEEFKKNKWPEDKLKTMLNRRFKSMLVTKYLLDKVESEGCLIITNEQNKQVKPLNIVGYGKV